MIDSQRKIRYNKAEVITMEKTMTLNLRVNPTVKQQAEDVLKQLGIPMATAIDMYLRQITLTGGIPFSPSLPKAPARLREADHRSWCQRSEPQEISAKTARRECRQSG